MKSDELDTLFTDIADSIRAKEDSTAPIEAIDFPERIASITTGSGIPSGSIIFWSGTSDTIPDGWHLCDGTNGTPDLRNKFVLGAGEKYAVGATGGSEKVTLTVQQMPLHAHSYPVRYASGASINTTTSKTNFAVNGTGGTNGNNNVVSSGSNEAHENMPPYYALCLIMKL